MHKLLVFEALIAFMYMLQEFNCSQSDADNFEYTYETDKVELNNIYLMKNELHLLDNFKVEGNNVCYSNFGSILFFNK